MMEARFLLIQKSSLSLLSELTKLSFWVFRTKFLKFTPIK